MVSRIVSGWPARCAQVKEVFIFRTPHLLMADRTQPQAEVLPTPATDGNAISPQSGGNEVKPKPTYYFKTLSVPLRGLDYYKTKIVTGTFGFVAKFIMTLMNNTHVYDAHHFHTAHQQREPGVGLVTVSNHVSAVDDPGILAALIDYKQILKPEHARWTLCATDRCYKSPLTGPLLSYGKTIPVQRGEGIRQPFMDHAVQLLSAGEWLHLFPEGKRTRTGDMLPLRPGVGRLIADAQPTPVVVPIFHKGMEQIMGIGGYNPVKPGRHVSIRCGPPVQFDDLIREFRPDGQRQSEKVEDALHSAITARLQVALQDLERASHHDIPWDCPGGQASEASRNRLGSWAPASFDKQLAMNAESQQKNEPRV